jgi:hypothetical protein
MSEKSEDEAGCCGESSAHFEWIDDEEEEKEEEVKNELL